MAPTRSVTRTSALDDLFGAGTETRLRKQLGRAFPSLKVEVEVPRLEPDVAEQMRKLIGRQTPIVFAWHDGLRKVGSAELVVTSDRVWWQWVEFAEGYRRRENLARLVAVLVPFFRALGVHELSGAPLDERARRAAERVGFAADGHHMRLDLTKRKA